MNLKHPIFTISFTDQHNLTIRNWNDLIIVKILINWVFHLKGKPIPFFNIIHPYNLVTIFTLLVLASKNIDSSVQNQRDELGICLGSIALPIVDDFNLKCLKVEL
jgi:hypothetical protein